MRICIAALFLTSSVLFAYTAASSKAHAKKTVSSKKSTAKHASSRRRRSVRRRAPRPSYQTHPTDERYKEIQQALADKGYYKGDVDGNWGDESVDALKKFQTDHQLDNQGKITSLSLLQLGLGPKHDGRSVKNENPALPPPPPPVTEEQPDEQQSAQ
ncbi:MAG TPA: peptidoglycan-binding domain-containing protein [Bryobacteraceae bacterium]|nr:peptidoglycan-binding domain-containing protein [Bryobacteraceae bacterium]